MSIIILLILVLVAMFLHGIVRHNYHINPIFLSSIVFGGYLLPQIIEYQSVYEGYSESEIFLVAVSMSIACLIFFSLGLFNVSTKVPKSSNVSFLEQSKYKLILVFYAFLGVSSKIYLIRNGAEATFVNSGQWSGFITIVAFMAKSLIFCYFFSLYVLCKKGFKSTRFFKTLFLVSIAVFITEIVVFGRRTALIELTLTTAFVLWFSRGWVPSRKISLIIGAGLIGFVTLVPFYREAIYLAVSTDPSLSIVDRFIIGLKGMFLMESAYFHVNSGMSDFISSLNIYRTVLSEQTYTYGADAWNIVIHRFIPAQIVGSDFKTALQIAHNVQISDYYGAITGAMKTGMAVSFVSFGFVGPILFFVVAKIYGIFYEKATKGDIVFQILCATTLYGLLLIFPSSIYNFHIFVLESFVFLLPFVLFKNNKIYY